MVTTATISNLKIQTFPCEGSFIIKVKVLCGGLLDADVSWMAWMVESRRNLGDWGEEKAADYLRHQGFVIRERNVRTGYGEIDIVASKKEMIVFVEVKTRRSKSLGPPEVSITDAKREKLTQSALAYMQENPALGDCWQIDVISVQKYRTGNVEIIHFENAIDS